MSLKEMIEQIRKDIDENPMTEEERQQFIVDCYNEEAGDLNQFDGIDCDVCNNKGWVQFLQDGYVRTSQCKCATKRKLYQNAKQSNLGEYVNKKIDDYVVSEKWQEFIKEKMIDYINNHSKDNVWVMACGQSGSGKTLLGSIIANHLLFKSEREVVYTTWTDFISRLKRDMMGDKTNLVSVYLENIKKCDVLFLDEVLKKYNETDLKYLIEIINYRYTNDKKTIITSERVLDELLEVDEATFSRAVEKTNGYLFNIPKDKNKNYRLKFI